MSVHSPFMVRLAAHVSKNHGVYLHMIIFYGFFRVLYSICRWLAA